MKLLREALLTFVHGLELMIPPPPTSPSPSSSSPGK